MYEHGALLEQDKNIIREPRRKRALKLQSKPYNHFVDLQSNRA